MSSHAVYRVFDADDHLLYVGMTLNLPQRISTHAVERPWWTDVARISVEHYESRDEADEVERRAIQDEAPTYNLRHARTARSDAERAARRERRAREYAELRAEWASQYEPQGVVCGNCGTRPRRLRKGLPIEDLDCPTCECRTLVRTISKEKAA